MKVRNVFLLALVGALLVPYSVLAQNAAGYVHRHTNSDRTAAAAALMPIEEGSESWGRLMVADRSYSEGSMRDLVCHLFNMDVETEYTLMIDDFMVGTLITDDEGEGWMHLQSPARNFPEVPEDLPAVGDLTEARILDGSRMTLLQGELVDLPSPPAGAVELVYLERTRLVDLEDTQCRGQARVARDVDDLQYFSSVAIGVIPNAGYRVEVDGKLAGTVTSNAGGVAELKLSTNGLEGALPAGLQPIEDVRLVEWYALDDEFLALTGTFAGINQVGLGGPHGGGSGHGYGGNGGNGNGEGGDGGDGGNGDGGGPCDGGGGDNGGGNGGGNSGGNGGGNGGGGNP